MNVLTSTFGLPYARLIVAKVQALNLKGWGTLSNSNTNGVLAEVVPAPLRMPYRGPFTSETVADVEWYPLTTFAEMGGLTCVILSYNLQWE